MRLLRRSKVAQATAIGAVMFIVIAMMFVSFLYEIYNLQSSAIAEDTQRASEKIQITKVYFGDFSTITNGSSRFSTTNQTGSGSFAAGFQAAISTASLVPISNMNFTTDASGWAFTRSYSGASAPTGDRSTDAVGSLSGGGNVYSYYANNPDSGTTTQGIMNWTCRFFVDLDSLGGPSALTSASLGWGRKCTNLWATATSVTIQVFLQQPNGTDRQVDSVTLIATDSTWVQRTATVTTSWMNQNGWYKVIIKVVAQLKRDSTLPNVKIYFDDIGLLLNGSTYIADWYGVFQVEQSKTDISEIDIAYAGYYSRSNVNQRLYIRDFTSSRWVQLSNSYVSTYSATSKFYLSGSDVQNYFNATNFVWVRVYSLRNATFTCTPESFSLSNIYTGTRDHIQVYVNNYGAVQVDLTNLWVISSAGHFRFNMTRTLAPAQTTTYQANLQWAAGEYRFKVVTKKGTIATFSAYA